MQKKPLLYIGNPQAHSRPAWKKGKPGLREKAFPHRTAVGMSFFFTYFAQDIMLCPFTWKNYPPIPMSAAA